MTLIRCAQPTSLCPDPQWPNAQEPRVSKDLSPEAVPEVASVTEAVVEASHQEVVVASATEVVVEASYQEAVADSVETVAVAEALHPEVVTE